MSTHDDETDWALDALGLCGCSRGEEIAEMLVGLLEALAEQPPPNGTSTPYLRAVSPDLLWELVLHHLHHVDLIEHGSCIGAAAWPVPDKPDTLARLSAWARRRA